jgi:predicted O-methyltransferase YrrM
MIQRISKMLAYNDLTWSLLRPFVKFAEGIRYYRKRKLDEPLIEEIRQVLKEPVVIHGPFKGLRYPDYASFGSAIYPKILGCYEREIYPFLDQVLGRSYEMAIDIGCAEGYYSVGLAKYNSRISEVIAVDISSTALSLARRIAELNGVSDRIKMQEGINADQLGAACKGKRNFVFCDCEGFEREVFTTNNLKDLSRTDLLIETHDSISFRVSLYLNKLFSETHKVHRVSSTDDMQKLNTYYYPELENLSDRAKVKLMSEGRGAVQEWFFCESLES